MLMNAGFFELDWDALDDVWSQAEIDEERANSEGGLGSVKQAATPLDGVPYVVMLSTFAQCASRTVVAAGSTRFTRRGRRSSPIGRTVDGWCRWRAPAADVI